MYLSPVSSSLLSAITSVFLAALALVVGAEGASAQGFSMMSGRNHPELEWTMAETPHFRIIYPEHLAGIEFEAAAVAETSYDVLATNFEVEFDRKIDIYLSDEDEIANGFAVPIGSGYTNIWVHVADFARLKTGREKWLRTVIAHELAHIFHYQKVLGRPRWLSFALADPLPSFWTEGIAQYETEKWTAQRGDRWLRTAVLDDRLSYSDGSSLWNGRLRYAVGNSQVRYLTDRYGDSTLVDILEHREPSLFGLLRMHDFSTAFEDVIGTSYRSFYDDWRRHVNIYYNTAAGELENVDSLDAAPLSLPGQYYFDVSYSPDTSHVATLSLTSLQRPVQRLFVTRRVSAETEIVAEGSIYGPVAWSPDGTRLAYSRLRRGKHGSLLRDIYVVGRDGTGRRRLTESRRAGSPSFSPDGEHLAFSASVRGTENIHVMHLETADERQVTHFTGDVQISSIRWHPHDDVLLFDRFTDDGRRDVAAVDLTTGKVTSLTSGRHDDRDPVWSPDGTQIAYASLRDDVPNVFVLDRATRRHARVTRLATGAEVHGWLPPDSTHADGTLIITSMVSKTGDEAFRIDASRRAEDVDVHVPAAYASWTTHRPPVTIPSTIAPDSMLIVGRGRYRSTRNIRHAMSLALPYLSFHPEPGEDWGIAGVTAWIEPLAKHTIFAGGALSFADPLDNSYALASYVNNQSYSTIRLSAYRLPGSARFYGDDLLVEAYAGGDVTMAWPLDWSDRPFTSESFSMRLRYIDVEPLERGSFEGGDELPEPEAGQQADLRVGFTWRRQRPYWNNVIHPLDGIGFRLRMTGSARILGADTEFVRGDASAFGLFPSFGLHRIFLYGTAQAQSGDPFAQNFVGLSRHDALQLGISEQVPLVFGDSERVRGYRRYALGNRMLFGTVEYRLPVASNLETSVLGVVSLGSLAGAVFIDAGMVWSDGAFDEGVRRTGLGFELKNALQLGGFFRLAHALGIAQPADALGSRSDYEIYYRIRTTVPF